MKKIHLINTASVFFLSLLSFSFAHAQTITTFAGNGAMGYSGDYGLATAAEMNHPIALARDAANNIYIADRDNSVVRRVSPAGIITTVAGNGTAGFSGDGFAATNAELNQPSGIVVDHLGNIYISDYNNSRVRKINTSGIISTYAGGGALSADGVPAISVLLGSPVGLAVDAADNLYIADQADNKIRMVNASRIISTAAGTGIATFGGDGGPATSADLNGPTGVAFDNLGNMYIADRVNQLVRIVQSDTIFTFAGNGGMGYGGEGMTSYTTSLYYPWGVSLDALGNVYIAEDGLSRVRKVDLLLTLNTVAGNGTFGYTGDGGPATAANIGNSHGTVADPAGNLYCTDYSNDVIRKITNNNLPATFTHGAHTSITICENATGVSLDTLLAINDPDVGQQEVWGLTGYAPLGSISGLLAVDYATGITLSPTGIAYDAPTGYVGLDSFTALVYDGSSIDTMIVVVTINPLPDAGTLSGVSGVCPGAAIPLSSSVTGGIWASTDTFMAKVSTTGTVTGIASGSVTIDYGVTNSCGTDVATRAITVNPLPNAGSITGSTNVLCDGAFTDHTPGGTWKLTNPSIGTISSAGAIHSLVISAGMLDTAMYIVSNVCGSDTALFAFTYECDGKVAVKNTATAGTRVAIAPNPAPGTFNISLSSAETTEASLIITNVSGQKIKELKLNADKEYSVTLNVPDGLYFITTVTAQATYTDRLLIQR